MAELIDQAVEEAAAAVISVPYPLEAFLVVEPSLLLLGLVEVEEVEMAELVVPQLVAFGRSMVVVVA